MADAAARGQILVVDDEAGAREALEVVLEDDHDVECVADGYTALTRIKERAFDLVLVDITMPELDGIQTLEAIKAYDDGIDVVMVSALDSARQAAASMKLGAYDYITKPFEADELLNTVDRVLKKRSLEQEVRFLRSEVASQQDRSQIISRSASMKAVFTMIDKVALTNTSVLITGESGTGKELVARSIHAKSQRPHRPFVAINCAAIPSELMESELFGHEKGAFTGALARTAGKFEHAHGGTIFLDEIASLKLELQAKLLRVLQEREFSRVGSLVNVKVDVRVIAATNNRLDEMVKDGRFRSDLYFRLNVIPIHLPPLRHRKEDIGLLSTFFLGRFNQHLKKRIKGISSSAMAVLEAYPWPGNIRELENLIERLVVLGSDDHWIEEKDLPFDLLLREETNEDSSEGTMMDATLVQARLAFERQYIMRALERHCWNQTNAARALGIHRNTLIQKMKALNVTESSSGLS